MKAIVRETYGPPDVLRLGDTPTNGDDGVLVRVHAASANAGDWHLLRGTPLPFRLVAGLIKPKYKIIGNDIAGTVEAVGRNVTQFKRGDEVFGEVSRCGFGAYAEYVVARENALALKPANLSFEEAASVPTCRLHRASGSSEGQDSVCPERVDPRRLRRRRHVRGANRQGIGSGSDGCLQHEKRRDDPLDWRRSRARLHTSGFCELRKEVRPDFGCEWRQVDLGLQTHADSHRSVRDEWWVEPPTE